MIWNVPSITLFVDVKTNQEPPLSHPSYSNVMKNLFGATPTTDLTDLTRGDCRHFKYCGLDHLRNWLISYFRLEGVVVEVSPWGTRAPTHSTLISVFITCFLLAHFPSWTALIHFPPGRPAACLTNTHCLWLQVIFPCIQKEEKQENILWTRLFYDFCSVILKSVLVDQAKRNSNF